MGKDDFWRVIEDARAELKDEPSDADYLRRALLKKSRQEIESFYVHYLSFFDDLDEYNVYVLGCILDGNTLSDDGFKYFRGWLVLMGRKVFSLALSDPDSIADDVEMVQCLTGNQVEYESFYYFIEDAYQEKCGASIYGVPLPSRRDDQSIGYVSLDEAERRLPKLTKMINAVRGSHGSE